MLSRILWQWTKCEIKWNIKTKGFCDVAYLFVLDAKVLLFHWCSNSNLARLRSADFVLWVFYQKTHKRARAKLRNLRCCMILGASLPLLWIGQCALISHCWTIRLWSTRSETQSSNVCVQSCPVREIWNGSRPHLKENAGRRFCLHNVSVANR